MLRTLFAQQEEGSPVGAAPVLLAAKLTNASLIEPLGYGDALVGLSGVYAIANAVRLAVADRRQLTDAEVHLLISAGFNFLSDRLTARQVFLSGCRVSVWRAMAEAMTEVACSRLGIHLVVERLFAATSGDRRAAFAVIENAIAHWQPVMMLCRGGRYTVVSGFTPMSLLLFDGGACWLSKRACGVPGDGGNERHLLFPASLMALRA